MKVNDLFDKEMKVSQVEIDLSKAKESYRQMFEELLHRLQQRWKKSGVRFFFDISEGTDSPLYRRFTLAKGPYAKNPNTGKKRRGWTVYYEKCNILDHYMGEEENGEPAIRWSIDTIKLFMESFDVFMEEYSKEVLAEAQRIKDLREEMGSKFGLIPPDQTCPICGDRGEHQCGPIPDNCPDCGSAEIVLDNIDGYYCRDCGSPHQSDPEAGQEANERTKDRPIARQVEMLKEIIIEFVQKNPDCDSMDISKHLDTIEDSLIGDDGLGVRHFVFGDWLHSSRQRDRSSASSIDDLEVRYFVFKHLHEQIENGFDEKNRRILFRIKEDDNKMFGIVDPEEGENLSD